MKIKALVWSEEKKSKDEYSFSHVTADTSIGQFYIDWQWKDDPFYRIYYPTEEYAGYECDLDTAKQRCQDELIRRIISGEYSQETSNVINL